MTNNTLYTAAGVLAAVAVSSPASKAATQQGGNRDRRPNFVIIITDQQRADLTAREGFPLDLTPFADSMAARGAWFDHAYTPCPASGPARVSLITGRYPKATGADSNHNIEDARYIDDLFGVAHKNGYKTALVGKNHTYMKKGDVVFCYRQGQFQNLHEALMERGIYGIGFVASNPKELFLEKDNHERYGVAIIFPYQMNNHLDLLNIQLHPNTISLTPYNGNRNDALQYISEPRHYETLLSLICKKNENLRDVLKVILDFSIPVICNLEYHLLLNNHPIKFPQ